MLGVDEAPSKPADNAWTTASRRKPRTVDVSAIEQLERDDCIERWRELFGVAPPRYTSLEFMRKALAYEAQVKAFGGHSNAVQRALKASLKAVLSEVETGGAADLKVEAHAIALFASSAEPEGVAGGPAPNAHQIIHCHNNISPAACDPPSKAGRGNIRPDAVTRTKGKADSKTNTLPKSTRSPKSTKPSVLSIRAGTHLVREWNGRTYQVEALEKGFRLDGKTYRSLSAIAKKITGAHWSGPRFFGLES